MASERWVSASTSSVWFSSRDVLPTIKKKRVRSLLDLWIVSEMEKPVKVAKDESFHTVPGRNHLLARPLTSLHDIGALQPGWRLL